MKVGRVHMRTIFGARLLLSTHRAKIAVIYSCKYLCWPLVVSPTKLSKAVWSSAIILAVFIVGSDLIAGKITSSSETRSLKNQNVMNTATY